MINWGTRYSLLFIHVKYNVYNDYKNELMYMYYSLRLPSPLCPLAVAPVQKRNKSKTKLTSRPASQPPNNLPGDLDKYSASSHSSQEDLTRARGKSPSERSRKGLSVHGECLSIQIEC